MKNKFLNLNLILLLFLCLVGFSPQANRILGGNSVVYATGGTTEAMIKLIESLGGEVVGVVVMMELAGLRGRDRIAGYRLDAAITYEGK